MDKIIPVKFSEIQGAVISFYPVDPNLHNHNVLPRYANIVSDNPSDQDQTVWVLESQYKEVKRAR